MLKVTIDLISANGSEYDKRLGTAIIYNDATGTPTRGNYVAELHGQSGKLLHLTEVRDFPRKTRTAWDLLYRALDIMIGARNKPKEKK